MFVMGNRFSDIDVEAVIYEGTKSVHFPCFSREVINKLNKALQEMFLTIHLCYYNEKTIICIFCKLLIHKLYTKKSGISVVLCS